MRITFLVGTLERGGAERLVVDLVGRLCGRHECHVICLLGKRGPHVQRLAQMAVPVLDFNRHPRDPRFVPSLAHLVRQLKPDLVHTQCAWSLPQQALAARLGGARGLVLTVHSTYGMAGPVARSRRLLGFGLSRRWISAIVGVSSAVSDWTESWLRLPSASVHTISNGVDLERFSMNPNRMVRVERSSSRGPSSKVLLAVGSLTEHKDHGTLLRALRGVVDLGLDPSCLIAGTGPLEADLKEMTSELGLGERVRFLGARDDVPELMRAAEVFVHTSIREGFGLAVAEAHAAGLPVVAANVGGIGEIVRDDISGILVHPRDATGMSKAIARLLADGDLRREMGALGKAWVEDNYSIDRCARKYEELYTSLLSSGSRQSGSLDKSRATEPRTGTAREAETEV